MATEKNSSVVYPETPVKFDCVFHMADTKDAAAVNLYLNATKLYYEAAHTNEVSYVDALRFAQAGIARIYDTDTFYIVTSYKESAGTLTLGYGSSKTVSVSDPSL